MIRILPKTALWIFCLGLPVYAEDDAFTSPSHTVSQLESKDSAAKPVGFESHLDWVRVLPPQDDGKPAAAPKPKKVVAKAEPKPKHVVAEAKPAPAKVSPAVTQSKPKSSPLPSKSTLAAAKPAPAPETKPKPAPALAKSESVKPAVPSSKPGQKSALVPSRARGQSPSRNVVAQTSKHQQQTSPALGRSLENVAEDTKKEVIAQKNGFMNRLARLTAYWAGEDYYTNRRVSATGIHLHGGHCAVDPSIIPYGSVVEIPGVGQFLAVDTGSAVVSRTAAREAGHTSAERGALVIDLFFEHASEGEKFAADGAKFVSISWWTPAANGHDARRARHLFADEDWNKIYSKQL
jgi:3D (Asp-Asp-Asp) domain-containing protein